MLTRRVIPCLDVDNGRVVKGVSFVDIRDAGDPAELAAFYNAEGADELIFLDITASSDARNTIIDVVEKVSSEVFIPSRSVVVYALSITCDRCSKPGPTKWRSTLQRLLTLS